ncbi:MFS transporter [Streptomyces sp. NPDC059506]|uniref:MFS transporter n=1 Tax=Streptomyces sp. NPDC059506 TaxID=3347751 RepID=UPI0036B0252E
MPDADTRAPAPAAGARTTESPAPARTGTAAAKAAATADERLLPGTSAYRRAILALFAAGTATFLLVYATQGLLPAISAEFSATPARASLTVSLTTGALAAALLPVSTLSEKYGRLQVMTASVFGAALVGLAIPFSPDLTTLVVLRALQGVALAGLPASAMAYLAEEVSPRALAGAVGLYVAGNSLGGMTSRLAAGWIAQWTNWRIALGVLGAASLLCAVTFLLLAPKARHFTPSPINPAALLRTVRGHLGNPLLLRLYLLGMLFMSVFGSVYTVLAYRLTEAPFHLAEGVIGSIFLVYLVGTFTSAVSGRLTARIGRRGSLYTGIATVTAGLLLTLADSLTAVLLGLVLITGGFFTGHVVASGSVSGTAASGRAQASALYMTAYYVGNSVGGTVGAGAYHSAGWSGTTAVALLAMAAAAATTGYATWRARGGRRAGANRGAEP